MPLLKHRYWDQHSPQPATAEDHLYVANSSDEPAVWAPFEWHEPGRGAQVCGEIPTIRRTGSTGTYMCGLWRTGAGIVGCAADGSATASYSAPLGDVVCFPSGGNNR